MNRGQVNISTDITTSGKVIDIKIDLTSISKRVFVTIIKEKNTSNKLNNKKKNCNSLTKITLHNAINITGIEKKNSEGLWATLSIEKNSNKLKLRLIRVSAHLENLSESEDIENPDLKI